MPHPAFPTLMDELRYHRIMTRLSQVQCARKLGYSKSLVHYWESAGRSVKLQHVIDYASLFGLEVKLVPKEPPNADH